MKNKILPITILILLIAIIGIRFKIGQTGVDKKNTSEAVVVNNQGVVKSAQVAPDFNPQSLKDLPALPNFKLPPQRVEGSYEPYVFMDAGILMDRDTFYPLWQKNAHNRVPIASTTKIMTAIIALENYNLNEVIEISQIAATQIGSDINLKIGEKITIESVLKAALIKSGNDAAYALAEKMGIDEFVNKMNEKVTALGLEDTKFKDPAGLDDAGYSSAFDLAVMASYAMKNSKFAETVKIPETTIYSVDGRFEHKLDTSNRLIKGDDPLYLPYVIGIKTGFTPDAGHCLVAVAEKDNHMLVSVVLHTNESTVEASAKETNKLLDWGYASYQW